MKASEEFRIWVHDNAPGYSPKKGGHKRCGELCRELRSKLSGMIEASCGMAWPAHPREKDFMIGKARKPEIEAGSGPEQIAERRLWRHWWQDGNPKPLPPTSEPLEEIHSVQVPLHPPKAPKHLKPKLGEIDLLGSTPNDLPAVIELKVGRAKDDTQEAIFHAWIQALAYTLTLRFYWQSESSKLRDEWIKHTGQDAPASLAGHDTPIIIMADNDFWDKERLWTEEFWGDLQHLCQILKDERLPVFAARFCHKDRSIVVVPWEKLKISFDKRRKNRGRVVCDDWPSDVIQQE